MIFDNLVSIRVASEKYHDIAKSDYRYFLVENTLTSDSVAGTQEGFTPDWESTTAFWVRSLSVSSMRSHE